MDASSTAPPFPRLRVSRAALDRGNYSTASSSLAGPSRLADLTQLVDLHLSDMHNTDEDDEQDQYPTPKMNTAAALTPSSATPTPNLAVRLRELIQRVPNSSASQTTPLVQRPPSPAFHESDFEGEHSEAGYSHARESLRGIFSKALREPGDTPQKGRTRKYSDGTSSRVDLNDWSDVKGKQRSLGDNENASSSIPRPINASHRSSRGSNTIDFLLKSISADDSDDPQDFPQTRRRMNPPNATMTSQSLHISQNSGFPQHSNLLDQDSEMHRAFGALESSDESSTQLRKFRGMNNQPPTASTVSTTPGPPGAENSRYPNKSLESTTPTQGGRRTSLTKTVTPPVKHKTSSSLQLSDQSSAMSVSDYSERVKEMEREKNREREREWNKRLPKSSRPGSSSFFHSPWPEQRSRTSSVSSMEQVRSGSPHSTNSIDSAGKRARVGTISGLNDRPRVVSAGNRPSSVLSNNSASSMDLSKGLRRHHSLTTGVESPDSKSPGNEVVHERERNWNAPRPKWHRRSLPNTPDRPVTPPVKESPSGHRNEHKASSTTPKDASNISHSNIKSPTTRRHSQAGLVPLSPSPAEKRSTTPVSNGKPSQFPRSPATSSRLKSHIPRPASPGRRRSQPSSNQYNAETPRNVCDVQEQSGDENMQQAKSMVSFPSALNRPSLYQESMELTGAYNVHEASSALPSFLDNGHHASIPNNDTMHTMSFSRFNDFSGTKGELLDEEDKGVAQEQTPTLQMLNPPPEESSSKERISPVDESYEIFNSTNEQHFSFPSVLSTPPRSRNDSKPQFNTPPPPKGLPDLPGPPSPASGDENQETASNFSISLAPADVTPVKGVDEQLRNGNTTFKTPKPPGGWLSTPGPFSRDQLTPEGRMNGLVESSDDGLPQAKFNHSRPMIAQTPMPPGGWMNTPAPHPIDSDAESVINEGGLTTPVASLGRASKIPLKTPAPPGAWALTPATARKSALKVRFDNDMSNEFGEMAANSIPSQAKKLTDASEVDARSSTPEPFRPITPPSRSPRKHKRSPSVRLVDAYGNERGDDRLRRRTSPSPTPSTPRNKSGIRIVDALGQEVQEDGETPTEIIEGEETPTEVTDEGVLILPINRVEALQRVKLGLQELAEGIESLDLTNAPQESEIARLKELGDASRALTQSREQLMQNMQRTEKELQLRVRQKIVRGGWLGRNACFLFFVGVIQVTLVFMVYRASILRARKNFLTNYYDPFNPDLFLYTTNPDTQYATPTMSWNLVAETVRDGDLTAFTRTCRTGLSILIKRLHREIWDVWGDDPNRPVGAWPPT